MLLNSPSTHFQTDKLWPRLELRFKENTDKELKKRRKNIQELKTESTRNRREEVLRISANGQRCKCKKTEIPRQGTGIQSQKEVQAKRRIRERQLKTGHLRDSK